MQTNVRDTSFLIHEPAAAYHAKAGHYLSSHLLADFRKCPLLYQRKVSGLIAENQERPAYLIGRAAHALILEGPQAFDDQFAVGGPINPRTGLPFGPNTRAIRRMATVARQDDPHRRTAPHGQADGRRGARPRPRCGPAP